MNDEKDMIDKIKEYYYPLMLYGSDDKDSVSPMISVQEKACRDPEEKEKIPNDQGYNAINAIKEKYQGWVLKCSNTFLLDVRRRWKTFEYCLDVFEHNTSYIILEHILTLL